MDINSIKDIPETVIAKKDRNDRVQKFNGNTPCKNLVVFHKEISDDGVCHYDSVIRNVASFVNDH
jgi:hypothetical protein